MKLRPISEAPKDDTPLFLITKWGATDISKRYDNKNERFVIREASGLHEPHYLYPIEIDCFLPISEITNLPRE